jgi:hypothetical protein
MAPEFDSHTEAGEVVAWEGRTFFWGRSLGERANLHDAIAAAVDRANQDEGTALTVVYSEVTSVGDPRPGAYSVILSSGGP